MRAVVTVTGKDKKGIIAKGVSGEGEKMFSCAICYK